jgi:hypothetical protein
LASGTTLPKKIPAIVVCSDGNALAAQLRPSTVTDGSALFYLQHSQKIVTALPDTALLTAGHLADGEGIFAIVESSSAPAQAGRLLSAIGSEADNWLSLTGDTATLAPNNEVATANIATATEATVGQAAKSWLSNKGIDAVAFLFVLALAFVVFRAWRRRQSGPPTTATETGNS